MARGGRYHRKQNNKKWIVIPVFVLILLAGLVFYYIRGRNNGPAAGITAPEMMEQNQISKQTAAEESLSETELAEEPNDPANSPVQMTAAETTETETAKEPEWEGGRIYEDIPGDYTSILQQYREVIMMDSSAFLELYGNESERELQLSLESLEELAAKGNLASVAEILGRPTLREHYPLVDGGTLRNAKLYNDSENFDPTVYHYAYYNIDGKGGDELLIGKYDAYYDDCTLLAIYTSQTHTAGDMGMKSVADDSRAHLTIYTDGTVGLDYSGGAAYHYWDYYRIDAEHLRDLFEPIASFYINYDASRAEYMSDAVEAYTAMLTPVVDIPWQRLIEG